MKISQLFNTIFLFVTFALSKDLSLETAMCQFTSGDVITVDTKTPLSVNIAIRWGETDPDKTKINWTCFKLKGAKCPDYNEYSY